MANTTGRSSRKMIAIGLLVLVAFSVVVTWVAATRIRSPAEVAARTEAPQPSAILVPAETRVVSSDIVTRGTGRFGSPQTLSAVPTALKPSTGFVDSVPVVGAEIAEGGVAMVLSGRPLVILQGKQPGYRDLGPGMSGSDVMQFEQALDRLGFWPGEIDGTYDDDTQLAVAFWYASLGYEPFGATTIQQGEIRSIQGDLTAAEREALTAAEAVAAARADVAGAQGLVHTATLAVEGANAAVATARSEADAATAAARAEARVAQIAAEQAFVNLPPDWADEEETRAALFELETLRLAAAAALSTVDLIRTTGESSVQTAEFAADVAPSELASAAAALSAAYARLDLANQGVILAESSNPQLQQDLARAQQRAGIQIPSDEILFVPETPVRVSEVHVQRGDIAEGPLFSVTDAILAIDGTLALDQVRLVEAGQPVHITEPDLGIDATGTVSLVAAGPGTHGADGFHVFFETLVINSATPPANIVGASVRLTLSVESTGGPVLAVPASAITLAVDGSSHVLVDRGGGNVESIRVQPGLAASGYVAVTTIAGDLSQGDLTEGDLVVIGFEQPGVTGG